MNILGFIYRDGYFQTWPAASKTRRWPLIGPFVYTAIRWLCGKLTGHIPSKTEWGYGGGGRADVWCRWCNEIGSIPLMQAGQRFENARNIIWQLTSCDIKQGQQWDGPDKHEPQKEQG